ncbi:MAG: STAS domain-containing protein [Desulfamplus sp.]|nr:STAS domain-containing protein [Desulfamplus sp.]
MTFIGNEISSLLSKNREKIHDLWKKQLIIQAKNLVEAIGLNSMDKLTAEVIDGLIKSLKNTSIYESEAYIRLEQQMSELSYDMTLRNITPTETARFIFLIKDAIFPLFQEECSQLKVLAEYILFVNSIVDSLGLYTFQTYLDSREALIKEQQRAFMDVSVPVVRVWTDIVLIPLVGMLDSSRTQQMMETMLSALEETQSKVAIIDISGIPIVDSLVARHLITAATAAKLMGAECLITGIRAKISQTLVQLGVDLSGIVTRTTLADGLKLALQLTGQKID